MMLNDGMNGKFRTCGELLSEWDGGTWGTEGVVEHSGILVGHLRWLANFGKQEAHLDGCSTVEIDLFEMDLVLQQCCTDFPQKLCGIM